MEHSHPDPDSLDSTQTPEVESVPEPRELFGFTETAELAALRQAAVGAWAAGDNLPTVTYRNEAEAAIKHLQGEDLARATAGLSILKSTVFRDAGDTDSYVAELKATREIANEQCLDDIVDAIDAALDAMES